MRRASNVPVPWVPRVVRAGEWRITNLSDGFLRLDGGSMWGVVPKNIWGELTPAIEDNTILLALRPFLAERGDAKVVIEVGIGDRWEPKWREIYHIERPTTLAASLAALGVGPADVTHVIASHCHFDHVGAQVVAKDGVLRPLFPRARHFAPAIEIEMARDPDHVRRASYRADDVVPLLEAGVLEGYGDGAEILPGIRAHLAPGHSDGVSVITVNEGSAGDTAIFWADVVPTTHHIQPLYIMAYDIDVVRSFENRSRWLARAAEGGWIGLFYHDADHAFGRLRRAGRRYELDVIAGEAR
ncbi:MAG: MBL fold metallo-hydrolase [Planctomycetota bacterium]